MRSRNWCFTYFPHKETKATPDMNILCQYMIYQTERCPSTGTIHLQGYAEFRESLSLTQVKSKLGHTTHLEIRRGSQKQAIDYCKKIDTKVGETYSEFGKPFNQGKRSDLDELHEAVCNGHTKKEILIAYKGSALRFINHIDKAMKIMYGDDKMDERILSMRKINKGNLLPIEGGGPPEGLSPPSLSV